MGNAKSSKNALIIAASVFSILAVIGAVCVIISMSGSKARDDDATRAPRETSASDYSDAEEISSLTAETSRRSDAAEQTAAAADYLSGMSGEEIRLMNLFLSNFSEVGSYDFDSSDADAMVDFVIYNAQINHSDKIIDLEQMTVVGESAVTCDRCIDASYVQSRVGRFFGKSVENRGTSEHPYADGKYYIVAAYGETHSVFTKVTAVRDNGNATLTVEYNVYRYDGGAYEMPPEEAYRGTASSKNLGEGYEYLSCGVAILKKGDPANAASGFANYQLISLKRS